MMYFSFLVVFEYFKIEHTQIELRTTPSDFYHFVTGITFLVVCYCSNEVVVQVSMCFKVNRTKNFTKSMILAMIMLFILYTVLGTFGYLTFGNNVAADLMKMYPSNDIVVIIGIIALVFKFTTSYIPFLFCSRDTIQEIVFENSDDQESSAQFKVRIIITSVLNVLILLPSVLVPNLRTVLNFLGPISVFPTFVYPGWCMISLSLKNYRNNDQANWKIINLFIFSLVLMILAVTVFVVALINAFNELSSADKNEFVC